MPNNKKCVLDPNKECDNCGKCNMCDLDPTKVCNNCGKCLNADGLDMSSIKIDSISEDKEDINNDISAELQQDETLKNEYDNYINEHIKDENSSATNDVKIEFIDDIDGLRDILEDTEKSKDYVYEEFPGLMRIKKK